MICLSGMSSENEGLGFEGEAAACFFPVGTDLPGSACAALVMSYIENNDYQRNYESSLDAKVPSE